MTGSGGAVGQHKPNAERAWAGAATAVGAIIPCHANPRGLATALASVLGQTEPCSPIVVDDGSPPKEAERIARIASEAGALLLRRAEWRGPAAARNLGLDACETEFVAFLDADDAWLPEKTALQRAHMERTGADFTYTPYANVGRRGARVPPSPPRLCRRDLLRRTPIGCSTVMVRRAVLDGIRFPEAETEDLAFWYLLLGRTGTAQRAADRVLVRRALGGRSRNKLDAAWRYWRTLRTTLEMPPPAAAGCFLHYARHGIAKHLAARAPLLPEGRQDEPLLSVPPRDRPGGSA
jgi:teichuronic acid biosynthesis glycosyltransferase TuaG